MWGRVIVIFLDFWQQTSVDGEEQNHVSTSRASQGLTIGFLTGSEVADQINRWCFSNVLKHKSQVLEPIIPMSGNHSVYFPQSILWRFSGPSLLQTVQLVLLTKANVKGHWDYGDCVSLLCHATGAVEVSNSQRAGFVKLTLGECVLCSVLVAKLVVSWITSDAVWYNLNNTLKNTQTSGTTSQACCKMYIWWFYSVQKEDLQTPDRIKSMYTTAWSRGLVRCF